MPRNTILAEVGQPLREVLSLRTGWAFSFILLPDGRRQILRFYLPGEIIDPVALSGRPLWFSVQALTDVEICAFDRNRFATTMERAPKALRDIDEAMHASIAERDFRQVDLGRRRAVERLAALVQEIAGRYGTLCHRELDGTIGFPLRHEHIGDALGLTRVHVSRVLGELREKGVVRLCEGRLRILDSVALKRLAGPTLVVPKCAAPPPADDIATVDSPRALP